jgi:hypothetical protein
MQVGEMRPGPQRLLLSKFDAKVAETAEVFVSIRYIQFAPSSLEPGGDFFCHLECLRTGFDGCPKKTAEDRTNYVK